MSTSTGRVTSGRPNKIADDDGRFDSRTRIAWLLRMNRLYGRDPDLAVARRCVSAFACRLGPVTPSQISRWENGVLPVPYRVIRAYEELLGLPAGHLTAAVDTVHQVRSVRPGAPRLDRGLTADALLARELDDLLVRCLGDVPMRAVDWDGMSARVVAIPHVYLPRKLWGTLTARLLAEMAVARGRDYQHRWEALRRLQGHPVAREAIAVAVAEMIADPASQVVVDPLMLLVHDRDATQLLVDEVTAPTSERTLRAALEVCELAATAGRFGGADARTLEVLARAHVADDGLPANVRRAAADLLSALAPPTTRQHHGARKVAPERAETVAVLVRAAEAALDVATRGTSVTENRMLSRLVDELLFAPQADVRLGAAAVLAASPFGKPLADALAGDRAPRRERTAALGMIGGTEHRPALETLLAGQTPHAVSVQAAIGLGNLPGRSRHAVLVHAVRHHAPARSEEVLRAVVYAAGMQRATPVLAEVRGRPDLPPEVRAAARWWLAQPVPVAGD